MAVLSAVKNSISLDSKLTQVLGIVMAHFNRSFGLLNSKEWKQRFIITDEDFTSLLVSC